MPYHPLNQQEFESLQGNAKQERNSLRANQTQMLKLRSDLAQIEGELKQELAKGAYANEQVVYSLRQNIDTVKQDIERGHILIGDAEANIHAVLDELMFELDPRSLVSWLDDTIPIFMMPLRVETRFMTVKHIARVGADRAPYIPAPRVEIVQGEVVVTPQPVSVHQMFATYNEMPVIEDSRELWVRIYPDDIAIHTHEEPLTKTEIEAGETFWKHFWYAGPDESLRIGAWRGLVGGRGPERAAWVAKKTVPSNHSSRPTTTTDPELPLSPLPVFPTTYSEKDSAWTQMPHSRVMPDRVIVRLYQGNSYREVVGKHIPDPLPVSLDPTDQVNTIDTAGGDLTLPDKLLWMQDFEAAEKVGMGIRVPLNAWEWQDGFDKIIVAGVKTSADKEEGKVLLEGLIENHHYTNTGFSVVKQGTPTNNTEDAKSGHTEDQSDDDALFQLELGDPLFTPTADITQKRDGQYLADALGIEYDILQNIRNTELMDVKEAMCMNTALWPTTLGYYLRHLMHPLFTESDMVKVRTHFNNYVLGRGRIPAIRVGSQPYGILATSAYSKFDYNGSDENSIFLKGLYNNVLKNMVSTWDYLVATKVTYAAAPGVLNAGKNSQFLNIVGLHPSSVEFYQRFVSGSYFLWNLYNYSRRIQGYGTSNVSYLEPLSASFIPDLHVRGFNWITPPRIFDLNHVKQHKYLNGPVIDRLKFSEERRIEAMGSNNENYIDWLIMSNWEQIKAEDFSNIGASDAIPPKALLYLMLRHSCLLEYVRSGLIMLVNHGVLSATALLDHELVNSTMSTSVTPEIQSMLYNSIMTEQGLVFEDNLTVSVQNEFISRANQGLLNGITLNQLEAQMGDYREVLRARTEPDLVAQVNMTFDREVSRLQIASTKVGLLNDTYPFVTVGNNLHEFITDRVWRLYPDSDVREMQELRQALICMKDVPTARLERCFAEHIDLVSYRLDAWFTSLASERLQKQRQGKVGEDRVKGTYLGAYGWLENVRRATPGIHYQEVQVRPQFIEAVGFNQVNTDRIQGRIPIVASDMWGQIDPGAVRHLMSPAPLEIPTMPMTFGREVPIDPVYVEYPFLQQPDKVYTGLSYAGAKGLTVINTMNTLLVDNPFHVNNTVMIDTGPFCTYLGTSGRGNIKYDAVKDKFIHQPRVDANNQGYIHAPSITHATTAAVLRAGYETHKKNLGSPDNALAVNLSSSRVRRAMFYIEGMRNGQELGALLGYQFERGLHDHSLVLDGHILEFRMKFPLVAGRVTPTGVTPSITTAEAYNVVNGLALVESSTNTGGGYPYGVSGLPSSGAIKDAIVAEVVKLHDALDSINDLLMAEAMHQVVQGNHPRAGSALNALSGKGMPADPQVVATPRSFHVLTHRTGIQFDLTAGGEKMWTNKGTPRSIAEPGLNRWLSTVLPDPSKIVFNYGYRLVDLDGVPGPLFGNTANAGDLKFEPIDLYYMLSQPSDQADATELVHRIAWYVQRSVAVAHNAQVEIAFEDRTGLNPDDVTLNELHPLMEQLRSLVGDSRALDAKDYLLASGAEKVMEDNPTAGVTSTGLAARLDDMRGTVMANLNPGMQGVYNTLLSEIGSFPSLVYSSISDFDSMANALKAASDYGIPNSMPLMSSHNLSDAHAALLTQAERVLKELETRLDKGNAAIIAIPVSATEERKAKLLADAAKLFFGRSFKVFPEFKVYNDVQMGAAAIYPDYLAYAGPEAVEEWLQGLSPVRKRVRNWHTTGLLSEALTANSGQLDLNVVQLPLLPLNTSSVPEVRWLGVEYPDGYEVPDEVLSLVFKLPSTYNAMNLQAGILVDEWTEEIPVKMAHTGIAVHFNNPDSEPAQTCLLAVSPNETGNWSWDDLMDTIEETLGWAKKRAVEPDHLNDTLFAQMLPATYAAISGTDDSPTLDYGRNIVKRPHNGVFDMINIKNFTA